MVRKAGGGDEHIRRVDVGKTQGPQKSRGAEGTKQADHLRQVAKFSSSIANPLIHKSGVKKEAAGDLEGRVTNMTRSYKQRGIVRAIIGGSVKTPRSLDGRVEKGSYREGAVPLRLAPAGKQTGKSLANRAIDQTPSYTGVHQVQFPPEGIGQGWGNRESEIL